ncbi:amino acid permease [Ophiostoma piceae UAMH 11346]|uniref:Amino acid permease n=1 Tax=Ophiostoma piceae (strain UAMH 11346) TaxID=1262450 RepID=S3BLW0_OPHP1|nr:amino acid permease [Ophiostoma piceae UAMH 11346]
MHLSPTTHTNQNITNVHFIMDWIKKASKKAKDIVHEQQGSSAPNVPAPGTAHGPASATGKPHASPLSDAVRVDDKFSGVRGRSFGQQVSNFPHIFRDGGGGGTVNGQHIIIFADGTYTRGLPPTDLSRMVNFVSNSIGILGSSTSATTNIARVTDVGTPDRGPDQAIPFLTNQGETPHDTAVWPNCNIATVVEADASKRDVYGVSFPEVIDRNAFRAQKEALLYNTPIAIRMDENQRPVVTRPQKSLFMQGEVTFGSFCVYSDAVGSSSASAAAAGGSTGGSGYLYLFGRISDTKSSKSNGLKLARVRPQGQAWANRNNYEYWDGKQWGRRMPAMLDDGVANVFNYSVDGFGKHYGPGSGDIWWSSAHQAYVMLFQNGAAALDNSVYLSYSTSLTGGWSKPVSVFKIDRAPDGFSYAFHAYPNMMDATGSVVPISWTLDSKAQSCRIYTGEIILS